MDVEAVLERVSQREPTVWVPVLRTCKEEIEEACREAGRADLAKRVAAQGPEMIDEIARKLGDILMEGGDYWEGMQHAVISALGMEG